MLLQVIAGYCRLQQHVLYVLLVTEGYYRLYYAGYRLQLVTAGQHVIISLLTDYTFIAVLNRLFCSVYRLPQVT